MKSRYVVHKLLALSFARLHATCIIYCGLFIHLHTYSRCKNASTMCMSYPATLRLIDGVSKLHTIPIKKWIKEGTVFKFWGDNVDKQRHVRDLRSDHQGEMLHMFSLLVGRSRTPAPEHPFTGQLSKLTEVPSDYFLPNISDITAVKSNMVVLVSRILTQYFPGLAPLSKVAYPSSILFPDVSEVRSCSAGCTDEKRDKAHRYAGHHGSHAGLPW